MIGPDLPFSPIDRIEIKVSIDSTGLDPSPGDFHTLHYGIEFWPCW